MKRLVMFPAIMVVLVLGACSTGTSEDDIGAFSDIAQAPPVIEFDPTGTAATLRVSTTLNAVCAVAYGVDGPYGAIATDQDMGIGGHSDHRAVMTNLEPDTEYKYRLQGVGEDGVIYRSEILMFTTPSAEATEELGSNQAIGAMITDVSSEFSADFAAGHAVDGDLATEWSSRGDGDDAFITIDLGEPVEVTAVAFRTRSMGDGSATTETFTVEVDGEIYGPFPAGAAPSDASFRGRYLTYRVESSSGGNTGAVEVEAYSR